MKLSRFADQLAADFRNTYKKQNVILSFEEFLEKVSVQPQLLCRNTANYLADMFNYYGTRDELGMKRFKMFDIGTTKNVPIIGGEKVHQAIYQTLNAFVRQNASNKLILLHGPNGSAKSSTVDAIAHTMNLYSQTEDGAAYTFNWIFPVGKNMTPKAPGETGPVGFIGSKSESSDLHGSYAYLQEEQISSKLYSEYRENPIFLLPMPHREKFLRETMAAKTGQKPEDIKIEPHLLNSGLSKKNQLVFDNLLIAYDGDLMKLLRHVQVERFFYSKQYRVGISTVEPQMSIDAREVQLTMDKNIMNLPSILNNIRFYEAHGQLVEANRGLLDFADLFKRPLETYKYLLTLVETQALNLPSSTTDLDIVYIATSNEKHLDAFKTLPDFTSFRERFELITAPYLLQSLQEEKIYAPDIKLLLENVDIAPHSLEMLATWAVLTRLKQPDPEQFDANDRPLISKLEPIDKVRLYNGQKLSSIFSDAENSRMQKMRAKVLAESEGLVVYEGRFGASPREVRSMLYRAAQQNPLLTPMNIFRELRRVIRDRTIYEFLQFEPRGKYHDVPGFIKDLESEFAGTFERECIVAMGLIDDTQYDDLMNRYVQHVVAFVKKEKLYDPLTGSYVQPSNQIMDEVESILGIKDNKEANRQGMLNRIAAYKLENKDRELLLNEVFADLFKKIKAHYYNEKREITKEIQQTMLVLDSDGAKNVSDDKKQKAEKTFDNLQKKFGYSRAAALACLKFISGSSKS